VPRFAVCIFCTLFAALLALMLLLAPSPAMAQDAAKPSATVSFGEGAPVGDVKGRVLMLGTDAPQPGFKMLAMAKYADRTSQTREILTDASGRFTIKLLARPAELRVFAFGDCVIPDGWSNIPIANMKFAQAEEWNVRVRPLRPVKLSGTVRLAEGRAVRVANVVLAPLDVARDGGVRVFDQPYNLLSDDDGAYSLEVPSGYYTMWAYWWDRDVRDGAEYFQVIRRVEIFADKKVDFSLSEAPTVRGKVIDARTGEGIAANIDLFSNQYLRYMGIRTADGEVSNEDTADGKEVFWPVGTFRKRFWLVDPENFTAVIRPARTKAVLRIIPDLKLKDLLGKEVVWKLYTEDMPVVDLQVTTHKHDLPINEIDVQLLPRNVDVPDALKLSLEVAGATNNEGKVRFVGLPKGEYEVYGAGGSSLLGQLKVEHSGQSAQFKYEIPFAFGKVKLESGELCRDMKVFISMTTAEGRTYDPYPTDPFYHNPALREKGSVFVPLLYRDVTFKLRFAAFENGRKFEETEYDQINNFPLVTEEKTIKVTTEDAWELDLTLKANPDYTKFEPRKRRD
jgi:hypothetical protein